MRDLEERRQLSTTYASSFDSGFDSWAMSTFLRGASSTPSGSGGNTTGNLNMSNIESNNICGSLRGLLTLDEPTACPKPCMMGELEGLQQYPGWGRTDITATNELTRGSRVAFALSDPFVSDSVRDRVNIGTPLDMREWTRPPGELRPPTDEPVLGAQRVLGG
jgi:hypothetical protein